MKKFYVIALALFLSAFQVSLSQTQAIKGTHPTNNHVGILGHMNYGAAGAHSTSKNSGMLGSTDWGVWGEHFSTGNHGWIGSSTEGVYGKYNGQAEGYLGAYKETLYYGVYGKNLTSNNHGFIGSSLYGLKGVYGTDGNYGYIGSSQYGIYGQHKTTSNNGILGGSSWGVYGAYFANSNYGTLGSVDYGVYGQSTSKYGVYGRTSYTTNNDYAGVVGRNHSVNGCLGMLGTIDYGVYGWGMDYDKYAGYFDGENSGENYGVVLITGQLIFPETIIDQYRIEIPNTYRYTNDKAGTAVAFDWAEYSDSRVKFNQRQLSYGLSEIMRLAPKEYDHHSSTEEDGEIKILDSYAKSIGFIAQELNEVIPEAANPPSDDMKDLWTVSYTKIIPVLVKAMQEQQAIIDNQDSQIEVLNSKLDAQQVLINQLLNDVRLLKDPCDTAPIKVK